MNFDTLLITKPENIQYLAGFSGEGFLLMKNEKLTINKKNGGFSVTNNRARYASGLLLTDARYLLRAQAETHRDFRVIGTDRNFETNLRAVLQKLRTKRLGFEARDLTVARLASLRKKIRGMGIQLIATENEIEKLREIKTSKEIQLITKACQITTRVLESVLPFVRVGRTEIEIAEEIRRLAFTLGADGLAFDPIVAFGANSAIPHATQGHRKLKRGDVILFDFGVKYRGYCSDLSRTFFTASPDSKQRNAYAAVLATQTTAIQAVQAGMKVKAIDRVAWDILKKFEFEKFFTHALGHGVGLEIHEAPSLHAKSKSTLRVGNVVTVEPGVYLNGKFGIRIEDTLLVTKTGAQILTRFPKELRVLKI